MNSLNRAASAAALFCAIACPVPAEPLVPDGQYTVAAQMVLPHLEEMRRHSEQHSVCVRADDVSVLFPVFRQPALLGCALEQRGADADGIRYELVCTAVRGGSGNARLQFNEAGLRGTLEAKMGGKNMTFSQFIRAERIGGCAPS